MGLFDFPRIHFKGDLDVNVPTINNSYYFPLTLYDAVRSEALFPPRLYFSTKEIILSVVSEIDPNPQYDPINQYYYINIEPICDIDTLRVWATTPVGEFPLDQKYLPYYQKADTDLADPSTPIVGYCPGYWNMYGDMGVYLSNVAVTGVQTFDGNQVIPWTDPGQAPADIAALLNAGFDLDTSPASGITTASMVETISSQSVYANIFCSQVNLYDRSNPEVTFLSGKPCRFSALIYSAWRVMNWVPPMAGSARFCSSIPIEEIEDDAVVQFFNNNKAYDSRPLKGVFVSFTILEVFENRYDQDYYKKNGKKKNPAQCTTVGSITPWYEGDMQAGILGRQLIAYGQNPAPNARLLAPAITSLRTLANGSAIFSVDMGNTWPEAMSPPFSPTNQPAQRGEATFSTYNLGSLIFSYNDDLTGKIGELNISDQQSPLSLVAQSGAIFDFVISDSNLIQNIQNNLISAFLKTDTDPICLLKESEYYITSDQKGLYTNQGDAPEIGYYVYNEEREPCKIRILQKGIPVTTPIPVCLVEFEVPEAANDPIGGPTATQWLNLADQSIVDLSPNAGLELKNNMIYYFVFDQQYPKNQFPPFNHPENGNYSIMDTGSFVCLRVHPTKDYSMYTDKSNPNYTPPTWDVVYEEVFKMYDVAYPIMAEIHPFTKAGWDNGYMAGLVKQRIRMEIWNDISYMPKSRELSASQRDLLNAWADYTMNKPVETTSQHDN